MVQNKYHILITGASSGIGEAVALEMATDGHNFFLTGRNQDRLMNVKESVNNLGGTAFIGKGDVSNPEDVRRLYKEAITKLGKIDVFIPNAGVGYFNKLENISIKEFDLMMDINVKRVFLWLKEVVPDMRRTSNNKVGFIDL